MNRTEKTPTAVLKNEVEVIVQNVEQKYKGTAGKWGKREKFKNQSRMCNGQIIGMLKIRTEKM